jgi:acetyl-CoA carboxylase carboxyl transferase subunit alpha
MVVSGRRFMTEGWLDFEKPIADVEEEIEELQAIGGFSDQLAQLRAKSEKLKQKIYTNLTPWQRVQLARHPRRPHTIDYIERITSDFVELHGDRRFADDPAILAGLGRIDNLRLAIIGTERGRDTRDKLKRNFGMPHPEGYRKALRVMQTAARFSLPILTLVDTNGAFPGKGAEERGQAEAIARNLLEMSVLPVPIVVVVAGEGGSGGALALAVGNRVLALENSIYSVITPEGCASILWRDGSRAEEAAGVLKITSADLLRFKIIDEVVPEPLGGAHANWDGAADNLKQVVLRHFAELSRLSGEQLISERVEKFRAMGVFANAESAKS